jgi:secreted PhoX family phosphatase
MDLDPLAAEQGVKRVCWTNTGNMTNGAGSAVEGAANYGELLCLEDEPDDSATTGAVPFVTRFVNGNPQLAMPDNVAFQPHSGRLVVLEDGPVQVLYADGSLRELRGNDIWMCLPDGDDNDVLSDGCIRIASLRDTDSEPTGFIFDASGERAFVRMQGAEHWPQFLHPLPAPLDPFLVAFEARHIDAVGAADVQGPVVVEIT